MKTRLRMAAAVAFLLLTVMRPEMVAAEPVLLFEGDTVVGARGLIVEGDLYDVEIIDDSCIELLDGCDEPGDFPFDSVVLAETASAALQALFSPQGRAIRGCDPTRGCSVLTPIDLSSNSGRVRAVDLYVLGPGCSSDCATQYGWETPEPDSDLTAQPYMVYAIWRVLEPDDGFLLRVLVPSLENAQP